MEVYRTWLLLDGSTCFVMPSPARRWSKGRGMGIKSAALHVEEGTLSGGRRLAGVAQVLASLGHLLPSWEMELVGVTRGAAAEKNPPWDVQY